MTIVITDATILILCAKIDLLDLVIKKFGKVIIPNEVYIEAVLNGKNRGKDDAYYIEQRIKNDHIEVMKIKSIQYRDELITQFRIHAGEAECITLFSEINAELLGTDDKKTINVCKILQISYFTVISFILLCIEERILAKSRAFLKLNKLQMIGWYKSSFLETIRSRIEKMEVE